MTLSLHVGLAGGWASPTLARLSAPDSPILLTPEKTSWIASLLNFGRLFGGILGPIATHYFGTKKSILATLIPISIGWLVLLFADKVEWLYIARLSSGLGVGMAFSTFPLYIGEISMPEIRGALITLASMGMPIGQLMASICGPYMTMSAAATLYLVLAIALILLFLWLPESPHHLMKIGNQEAARMSIKWYRNNRYVDDELQAVKKLVAPDSATSFLKKIKDFNKRHLKKATLQIVALFIFMQISGVNVIMFYMEIILTKANFTLVKASTIVIYANIFCTISSAISIFLIDQCGRKFLLLLSSAGTAGAMIALTMYFFLVESNVNLVHWQWLPGISVIAFMAFYYAGMNSVPKTILSEIFSTDTKCIAAGISSLVGAAMSFLSTKTYQPMIDVMGEAYVFLIYVIGSLIAIPYTVFMLSETKGKSLQEIQDEIMNK